MDATFMAGVPGVVLMTDKQKVNALQHMIQDMCNWSGTGFPGCQPVSMDRNNILLLHTKPYKVSWKADGTRYMMLINGENEIYFFDRDNSCFKVEGMTFLRRDLRTHIKNTLVDGEMVIDRHAGQNMPRFLIYDFITYDGESVIRKSFDERLFYIKSKLLEPRVEAMKQGIIKKELEPFSVRNKEFWPVTTARSLLSEKFAKSLSHEPDGLIFQPKLEPYVCGRCDDVLKWKPSDQNSVDFKLKIMEENGVG
jgi:mRNA-capping enzyme